MKGKRERTTPSAEPAAGDDDGGDMGDDVGGAAPSSREVFPCTHDLGHVRQDVYSCRRCSSAGTPAGFCSSCKQACHGEHLDQVFDLYSKRGFRCDCGNHRTKNSCLLEPHKEPENAHNCAVYSHNFEGRYCHCDRGYDPRLGDMSQCFMCEDWFHSKCYTPMGLTKKGAAKAMKKTSFELSCSACVASLPILRTYFHKLGKFVPRKAAVEDIYPDNGDPPRPVDCTKPTTRLSVMPKDVYLLWQPGFRESLCTCAACRQLYKKANAEYIVDPSDVPGAVPVDSTRVDTDAVLDGTSDGEIVNDVRLESQEEREEKRQRLAEDAVIQRDIQERISSFLERCVQSDGQVLSHSAVRNYLNDVKSEVISNMDRESEGS